MHYHTEPPVRTCMAEEEARSGKQQGKKKKSRAARRGIQRALRRAAKEARAAAFEPAAPPAGGEQRRAAHPRPSRRPVKVVLRPSAKVRPAAPTAQPKGEARGSLPCPPVARVSSEEEAEGEYTQWRPLVLFPGAPEDCCEWCLHPFSRNLPWVPAGSPLLRGGRSEASASRRDLRLCSGCVPVHRLVELGQLADEHQREFLRLAVASLLSFCLTPQNHPLPHDLLGFSWVPPRGPRRANPYGRR